MTESSIGWRVASRSAQPNGPHVVRVDGAQRPRRRCARMTPIPNRARALSTPLQRLAVEGVALASGHGRGAVVEHAYRAEQPWLYTVD